LTPNFALLFFFFIELLIFQDNTLAIFTYFYI
jgi:hypothetical protein